MIKKADTKVVIKKRIELEDSLQDKLPNQKKSWSQKRENMETDINVETYSYDFIDFIFNNGQLIKLKFFKFISFFNSFDCFFERVKRNEILYENFLSFKKFFPNSFFIIFAALIPKISDLSYFALDL